MQYQKCIIMLEMNDLKGPLNHRIFGKKTVSH